jgi:hypothetical protein
MDSLEESYAAVTEQGRLLIGFKTYKSGQSKLSAPVCAFNPVSSKLARKVKNIAPLESLANKKDLPALWIVLFDDHSIALASHPMLSSEVIGEAKIALDILDIPLPMGSETLLIKSINTGACNPKTGHTVVTLLDIYGGAWRSYIHTREPLESLGASLAARVQHITGTGKNLGGLDITEISVSGELYALRSSDGRAFLYDGSDPHMAPIPVGPSKEQAFSKTLAQVHMARHHYMYLRYEDGSLLRFSALGAIPKNKNVAARQNMSYPPPAWDWLVLHQPVASAT